MRLPACAPLRIAAGGAPSITVRETFEMAGARTEATTALAVTSAVFATNGLTSAVIVATATIAVTAVASALVIAGKIVSVANAVLVAKPAVKIVLARSPKATVPVADTTVATAPKSARKRAASVGHVERVAANEAMMGAAAATFGVEVAAGSGGHHRRG